MNEHHVPLWQRFYKTGKYTVCRDDKSTCLSLYIHVEVDRREGRIAHVLMPQEAHLIRADYRRVEDQQR